MKTTLVSVSASNSFLSADGLLNFDAVVSLQKRITEILKKAEKAGKDIKPVGHFVMNVKAKPVKYSAALAKKDDHKYTLRRATKIAIRKTVKPEALARVKILLTSIGGADAPAALVKQIKSANVAIAAHIKKIPKVKDVVTKKKGKLRDAANKEFDKAVAALTSVLLEGGLSEKDLVVATGMMGKTVLVRLNKESVVSIGKADMARFNAARKAAA
jgi:hypothetical protein